MEQKVALAREQLGQLEQASEAFAAHTELVEGLRTRASVRQFNLTVDEPESSEEPMLGRIPWSWSLQRSGSAKR